MNLMIPEIAAAFILTFARVGTLVMLMPGIGEQLINARARLAFALALSLVMFPATRPLLPVNAGAPAVVTTLLGEVAIGLVLGLSVRMVLAALQTAGTIVARARQKGRKDAAALVLPVLPWVAIATLTLLTERRR